MLRWRTLGVTQVKSGEFYGKPWMSVVEVVAMCF